MNTLIFLLLCSLILSSVFANDVHCNCVSCNYKLHLKGSSDWCRCCAQAMIPECRGPNSAFSRCRRSIFDSQGCIRDGYLTKFCQDEVVFGPPTPGPTTPPTTTLTTTSPPTTTVPPTSPPTTTVPPTTTKALTTTTVPSTTTPTTTVVPTTTVPSTTTLAPTTTLSPTSPPTTTVFVPVPTTTSYPPGYVPPCNCVLCESPHLIVGGDNWCRCCQVEYELPRGLCGYNYRCRRSVFDLSGCQANNWQQRCQGTQNRPNEQPNPFLEPVVNKHEATGPEEAHKINHQETVTYDPYDQMQSTSHYNSATDNEALSDTGIGLIVGSVLFVLIMGGFIAVYCFIIKPKKSVQNF